MGLYEGVINMGFDAVLSAEVDCDGVQMSLRQYLKTLLITLWREEQGFSGKRPFGNSGWQTGVYCDLVKAGVLDGVIDADGYLESVDHRAAEELIIACIERVFNE